MIGHTKTMQVVLLTKEKSFYFDIDVIWGLLRLKAYLTLK